MTACFTCGAPAEVFVRSRATGDRAAPAIGTCAEDLASTIRAFADLYPGRTALVVRADVHQRQLNACRLSRQLRRRDPRAVSS